VSTSCFASSCVECTWAASADDTKSGSDEVIDDDTAGLGSAVGEERDEAVSAAIVGAGDGTAEVVSGVVKCARLCAATVVEPCREGFFRCGGCGGVRPAARSASAAARAASAEACSAALEAAAAFSAARRARAAAAVARCATAMGELPESIPPAEGAGVGAIVGNGTDCAPSF